ncbi:Uncharacterised protein [uncultured archaeon]|nr:Uncharacterised protein [uncultured archaeon]
MKGQGLPISTIIIAALGILVLVVIGAIFGSQITKFGKAASECSGRCYKLNAPAGAPPGIYDANKCNAEFETKLSGSYIPKNMPSSVANPSEWRCDECCILTG